MVKATKEKYSKAITVRLPSTVHKALIKKVKHKKKDFSRYEVADAIRIAIVNDLKNKGYLKRGKDYL